jgi:hypothetical protein
MRAVLFPCLLMAIYLTPHRSSVIIYLLQNWDRPFKLSFQILRTSHIFATIFFGFSSEKTRTNRIREIAY